MLVSQTWQRRKARKKEDMADAEQRVARAAADPAVLVSLNSRAAMRDVLFDFCRRNPASSPDIAESLWIQARRRNGLLPDPFNANNEFIVGKSFRSLLSEAFREASQFVWRRSK